MSDTMEPKVVDRLRKLLALANNNTNEHEAAAAMAKAQELMAEYNVEMATIEASGGKTEEGGVREKAKLVGRALYQYQRELMRSIADANFCYCFVHEYSDKQGEKTIKRRGYQLIGRKTNVATTVMMFDYLNQTMERLVPIGGDNRLRLSKFAISWKEGCASRLRERIYDRRVELEKASQTKANEHKTRAAHPGAAPQAGALMVLGDITQNEYELNMDFLYGQEPGTTTQRRLERDARRATEVALPPAPEKVLSPEEKAKQDKENQKYQERWQRQNKAYWGRKDMSAYYSGQSAGENISLDQQVGSDPLKTIK